jgi:hypothetical protein
MIILTRAAPLKANGTQLALIQPFIRRRRDDSPYPVERPRRPQNHLVTYSPPFLPRPRVEQRRKL